MGETQPLTAVGVGKTADAAMASRRRAAIELIRRHERTLRRTARRYSLCVDDAEDAMQRALEILLRKAPTSDQRELIRWMQTVTKHEALAVRRHRERQLGSPTMTGRDDDADWVQLIPSGNDGPADTAERRERVSRAREALKALKPHELRALTLLAEGYSYAEICQRTGWTYTKVNRCLAEGRQRFRSVFGSIEEGRRCEELAPALSAFVDGEASSRVASQLQAHLRECSYCRAEVRAYRAAPPAAAALAPTLAAHSLGDRFHDLVAGAQARLPGRTGATEAALGQFAAAGGSRGTGLALTAKVLTACVGTAGGAAACLAAGVTPPVPVGSLESPPKIEKTAQPTPNPESDVVPAAPVPETASDPAPVPAVPEAEEETQAAPPPADPQPAAEFSPEVTQPAAGSSAVGVSSNAAPSSGGSGGGGGAGGGPNGEFGP